MTRHSDSDMLKAYAEFIRVNATYFAFDSRTLDELTYLLGGLSREASEAFDPVVKLHYKSGGKSEVRIDPKLRQEILLELGDVLWYLQGTLSQFFPGVTIMDLAVTNMVKLHERHKDHPVQPSQWSARVAKAIPMSAALAIRNRTLYGHDGHSQLENTNDWH